MQKKIIKLAEVMLVIFIFALAFFIRFYNVGLLPINHDEAAGAWGLLENPGPVRIIFKVHTALIYFFFYLQYLQYLLFTCIRGFKISGLDDLILRLRFSSISAGGITLLLVYILARYMYGCKTAIISSILLCFLPWHIIQSRIAAPVNYAPLFGCLIFLCLFKASQTKGKIYSGLWFLLSCLFLKESLKTHGSAILFILIFLVLLITLTRKINYPMKARIRLIAILITAIFIFSFACNIIALKNEFWHSFFRGYHKNIFEGSLFLNLWGNFKNNFGSGLNQLFFSSEASLFLYGRALKAPLLIHPVMFFLLLISLGFTIRRRTTADKILLIWLFLGFLGVCGGASFFQARYILIILPPLLILPSKFIAKIFERFSLSQNLHKRLILLIGGILLLGGLVNAEIIQWTHYYYNAPFDLTESIHNSYGCREAAEYLSQITDIKDYIIITDVRMTVDVYLNFYLLNEGKIDKYWDFRTYGFTSKKKGEIHVLWAPESRHENYWEGLFRWAYTFFRQTYPDEKPIKVIYYPTGQAVIHIFKIEDGDKIR